MKLFIDKYVRRLSATAAMAPTRAIERFASALPASVKDRNQVLLAGNGGSARNAMRLANDCLYGTG